MANRLSDIVNVNIDISAPAVDSASFDNLLIVGPPPGKEPPKPLPPVGVYADLAEVADAGFAVSGDYADPVGIAARIAFSQNPKPSRIYIAAQHKPKPLLTGGDIKIITPANALSEGFPPVQGPEEFDGLPWLQMAYSRKAADKTQVIIEKDGMAVFSCELPTMPNNDALIQVSLGASENALTGQMGLPPESFAGEYTVIMTSERGSVETVLTQAVIFDGTDGYIPMDAITSTTPDLTTPADTLSEALDMPGWYVACPAGIPESEYPAIAEWAEAQAKLFAYTFMSQPDPVGAVFYRSFGICGLTEDGEEPGEGPTANKYLHVAMAAKCLAYPAGSETWAFKQLAAVYPSNLSGTLKAKLTDGHSNYFTQYAGRNVTMNGQVRAGEWIDIIRGRDWLQNDMQLRLFNLLLANPKIPYTNSGIAQAQNEMIASLKAAQDRGIVAESEYGADGEQIPGFKTDVPNSQSLTATQKASRILQGCTFSARIAGAIHAMNISGSLTY